VRSVKIKTHTRKVEYPTFTYEEKVKSESETEVESKSQIEKAGKEEKEIILPRLPVLANFPPVRGPEGFVIIEARIYGQRATNDSV